MSFSADLLMSWLASYIWPFCRLSGLLMSMIVVSSQSLSVTIRVQLAFVLTLALSPLLPPMPQIELFGLPSALICMQQLLIGVAMGLCTQFLIQSFVLAGQVIAMQTGLGFASMVDPINGGSTPVIGQFYLMLGSLIFFAIDGHMTMLHLLQMSFTTLPVSTSGLSVTSMLALAGFMTSMFQTALSFSLSAIVAMLLINFTFGVMTRAAPQLNIFSMGFSVSMICGLLVLRASFGSFMDHFLQHWQQVQSLICQLINTQCSGG